MWRKLTVEQYQALDQILISDLDELDKLSGMVGLLYDLTEKQVDDMDPKAFGKLAYGLAPLLLSIPDITPRRSLKSKGRYIVQYDVGKIRFGQYIEVQGFLKRGLIENLHNIAASIVLPFDYFKPGKNRSEDHEQRAQDLLKAPFLQTYWAAVVFLDQLGKFHEKYKSLLGSGEEGEETDPFSAHYGWTYSLEQVAKFERITVEQTTDLPVVHAFNTLAYLKAWNQKQEADAKKRDRV